MATSEARDDQRHIQSSTLLSVAVRYNYKLMCLFFAFGIADAAEGDAVRLSTREERESTGSVGRDARLVEASGAKPLGIVRLENVFGGGAARSHVPGSRSGVASEAFRAPSAAAGGVCLRKTRRGAAADGLGQIVKGNKIQAFGRVAECRGGKTYLVQLDNSQRTVLCELGGALYRRRKLLALNARVKIEVHLLAPNKGRIVERIDALEDLLAAPKAGKERAPVADQRGKRRPGGRPGPRESDDDVF
ncbi:translation initiation factor IF-1 [Babesia caballi]|uniref:Translation initiation factor IF-1 n=1 Tax=Babesia caballi TaxID=5871 RepID=A0AAV4LYE6_BABCB|nr:translation initiation factor IF-1 [Babesia caballi]